MNEETDIVKYRILKASKRLHIISFTMIKNVHNFLPIVISNFY